MESITIYPKNEKQKSLLKSLLEEMKIRFKISKADDTLMTEEEFYAKIDSAKQQAKEGKGTRVGTKEDLHTYLNSL
ncbi:MAG: hypothetical protein JSS98_11490 [Bacteroidetes bacterium]|nr:hypothetical protein [Bacteroidota bacterium]